MPELAKSILAEADPPWCPPAPIPTHLNPPWADHTLCFIWSLPFASLLVSNVLMCLFSCFQALSKMHLRSFCNLHFKFSIPCLQFNHVGPHDCSFFFFSPKLGFPGGLSGKESACQCRRHGFDPWVKKIPWRRKWQPTAVYLSGKAHGQRSVGSQKSWTWLSY